MPNNMVKPDARPTSSFGQIIFRIVGWLVTLAACIFIGFAFFKSGAVQSAWWREPQTWFLVFLLGCGYGISLGFITWSWFLLIDGAEAKKINRSSGLKICAAFQVLKYIPSNLVHHAGRYTMMHQMGLSHGSIVWSSLAESFLIVVAAAILSAIFGFEIIEAGISYLSIKTLWLLFISGFIGVILLIIVSLKIPKVKILINNISSVRNIRYTLSAFFSYMIFFILIGVLFWFLSISLLNAQTATLSVFTAIAGVSAAWVIGFLAPGAPAGIGIRETILVLALGTAGIVGAEAINLVAFYRLVSVIGDAVYAVGAYSLSKRMAKSL